MVTEMKEAEPGSRNTEPVLPFFPSLDVSVTTISVLLGGFFFFREYTQSFDLYYSHCIQLNEIYGASCTVCSLFELG